MNITDRIVRHQILSGLETLNYSPTTRALIEDFHQKFNAPVRTEFQYNLSIDERLLRGKLLLEEVMEYLTKGLGLTVGVNNDMEDIGSFIDGRCEYVILDGDDPILALTHREGSVMDPIEIVDGLSDINVVIHGSAHVHGFNLDLATEIVHESNMSKLDADGEPIVNGVTAGYRDYDPSASGLVPVAEDGFDPSKPVGKILKGPNFWEPKEKLAELIGYNLNTDR